MTRSSTTTALALSSVALFSVHATAQDWSDGFESYADNSAIEGQGGWTNWTGANGSLSVVSSLQANSGTQSLEVNPGADTVHTYGYSSGSGTLSTSIFIPSTSSGEYSFLLMDEFSIPAGPYEWGGWIVFDTASGVITCNCGGTAVPTIPLSLDTWIPVEVDIDLDNDSCDVTVDGTLMATYVWSTGWSGGGAQQPIGLEAVDLYPTPTAIGPFYYDDFDITWLGDQGSTHCSSSPLSTGASNLTAVGSASIADNELTLVADNLPAQPGIFIGGPNFSGPIPFFNGFLCVSPSGLQRFSAIGVPSGGSISEVVDIASSAPGGLNVTAGSPYYYQRWNRDPAAGGGNANFSSGLQIDYTP